VVAVEMSPAIYPTRCGICDEPFAIADGRTACRKCHPPGQQTAPKSYWYVRAMNSQTALVALMSWADDRVGLLTAEEVQERIRAAQAHLRRRAMSAECCGCICERCARGHDTGPPHTRNCIGPEDICAISLGPEDICDEAGHHYDIVDGRCRDCGSHAPPSAPALDAAPPESPAGGGDR
jgi:hypothetical protein